MQAVEDCDNGHNYSYKKCLILYYVLFLLQKLKKLLIKSTDFNIEP